MIIFLNGSINAGKSTVAKLLVKELPNTALVEIDALREMIAWMPIDESVPINLENAVAVIRNFAKQNLNMIVPYPLSEKNYRYIMDGLSGIDTQMHVFALAPSMEIAQSDRGERQITKQERDRIKYHYDIGIHNPTFGEVIDNTHQTPEETAEHILRKITI